MGDLDTNSYKSVINGYYNQIFLSSGAYLPSLKTIYTTFNDGKNVSTGATGAIVSVTSTCSDCSSNIISIRTIIDDLNTKGINITGATNILNTNISGLQGQLNGLNYDPLFQQNKTANTLKSNLLEMYNSQYLLNVEILVGICLLCFGIYKLMFYKIIDFTSFFQTYIYGPSSNNSTK